MSPERDRLLYAWLWTSIGEVGIRWAASYLHAPHYRPHPANIARIAELVIPDVPARDRDIVSVMLRNLQERTILVRSADPRVAQVDVALRSRIARGAAAKIRMGFVAEILGWVIPDQRSQRWAIRADERDIWLALARQGWALHDRHVAVGVGAWVTEWVVGRPMDSLRDDARLMAAEWRSHAAIAAELGVHQSTVSRWLVAKRSPEARDELISLQRHDGGLQSGAARRAKSKPKRVRAMELDAGGMSQRQIAAELDCHQSTVSRWLNEWGE